MVMSVDQTLLALQADLGSRDITIELDRPAFDMAVSQLRGLGEETPERFGPFFGGMYLKLRAA